MLDKEIEVRDKKRGQEREGRWRRALVEKKELQTNSEGKNIINRSTETIKQCKYEKCQAQVNEPVQE